MVASFTVLVKMAFSISLISFASKFASKMPRKNYEEAPIK